MSDFVTVAVDGYNVTSTSESAEGMIASLTPPKDDDAIPREVKDDEPEATEDEKASEELSKAASALGKKGGEANAAKKAAEAKEQDKADKAEAATAATEASKEAKKGNPRHDPTARVTEATREAKEAREEAARERAEKQRLADELAKERAAKATPAPEPKPVPTDDPEPQEADFPEYKDYVKAAARWAARDERRQGDKIAAERDQATARDAGIHKVFSSFFGQLGKATAADPTFKERTGAWVGSLQPTPMLAPGTRPTSFNHASDEILLSESVQGLIEHFVEHPSEFQRIAALGSRRDVAREMAKVEARLEASEAAITATSSRPEVSKAKPPVRPVAGSPHTATLEPGDDAPYDEHARFWNAKERRR